MNLSLPRLALILAGAAVLGYLTGHDEPAPERPPLPPAVEQPALPAPSPPGAAPWQDGSAPSDGYAQRLPPPAAYRAPDRAPPRQPPYFGQQFRPLPDQRGAGNRNVPGARPPEQPRYAAPAPRLPQTERRYQPRQPGYDMPDRFRPLEEQEQTRRWQGSYRRMSSPPQFAAPGAPGGYRVLAGPT
jgi:hypothetical protein